MPTGFLEVLSTAQGAGTALASFTTAATILPPQALHTINPDDWYVGKSVFLRAAGVMGNVTAAQPTFTFNLMFGSAVVFTTGALLCSTTVHTAIPWYLEAMLTCRAVGATANLMGQGWVVCRAFLDAGATGDITTLGHPILIAPETTPAVGANFNSNASQSVDLQVACSASNASNTIQLHQYWLMQTTF